MTQRATPETVVAPFRNEELEFEGQLYRLERENDRFFVSVDAPMDRAHSPTETVTGDRREVVMTTGSHHIQVYWISEPTAGLLIELPFYYHIEAGRWVLRDDTMLHPPGQPQVPSVWNNRCIKCHSVNGVPGLDPKTGTFSTRVAELGISCEACHGPGRKHVELQKAGGSSGDSIINPRKLDSHAATQVCGRCHSASQPLDPADYLQSGLAFRPGDDLHAFITLNDFDPRRERPISQAGEIFVEDYPIDGYWRDGTCRVGGDEYNALRLSPCYERGAMSCLSCHSMHASDPNDQLGAWAQDNNACTQCHQEPRFNEQLAEHTHHAPGSHASQCYNCHMPHTSYALLKAIRNHRVSSPNVLESVQFRKPNACNLCHTDRTLKWTSEHLADWYDIPEPELDADQEQIAASVLWLLKGNAALRIVTVWHLGWAPALEASGTDWQTAFLGLLLDDPYSAVRFVAARSLREFTGFEDLQYDYVAPPETRYEAAAAILEKWQSVGSILPGPDRSAVLLDPEGRLRASEVARLLQQRDNRPVSIAE